MRREIHVTREDMCEKGNTRDTGGRTSYIGV